MLPSLICCLKHWLLQDYLGILKRCLNQHNQMGSSEYLWEARLHQLTFEAFMLAEEVFKQRARVYDSKAMTVCRHHHSSTPDAVHAQLLVSHCQ